MRRTLYLARTLSTAVAIWTVSIVALYQALASA
jgi:hypothetical protein